MVAAVLDISAFLLACCAGLIAVPAVVLVLEVIASFLPARAALVGPSTTPSRFAILMPAHNEAQIIQATLHKILPELSPGDRLIVIADNCSDQTGLIAQQAGAEVIYRNDPDLRGKGYALDHGVRHLEADPTGTKPDVVIIMDADCWSDPGAMRQLADAAYSRNRPVQAFYELETPPSRPTDNYLSIASLAWNTKNFARPLGLHRLGLPCQLMGTGMAFPWNIIAKADLKTANIVEDLALGLELADSGKAATFLPETRVISQFPISIEGQQTQRTRWEAGHLKMITGPIPALLLKAVRRANRDLFVLAADALVPPLTLLVGTAVAVSLLSIALATLGGSLAPLVLATLATGAIGLGVLLAAARIGKLLALMSIVGRVPAYAASKIAIYSGAFSAKPIGWIRSKRD